MAYSGAFIVFSRYSFGIIRPFIADDRNNRESNAQSLGTTNIIDDTGMDLFIFYCSFMAKKKKIYNKIVNYRRLLYTADDNVILRRRSHLHLLCEIRSDMLCTILNVYYRGLL